MSEPTPTDLCANCGHDRYDHINKRGACKIPVITSDVNSSNYSFCPCQQFVPQSTQERKEGMKTGVELIADERQRQIEMEQWSSAHDDRHIHRELARAAFCYVEHYVGRAHVFKKEIGLPVVSDGEKAYRKEPAPRGWPWGKKWWKPKDPKRDLIRAGALIAAEIDRLQRKGE